MTQNKVIRSSFIVLFVLACIASLTLLGCGGGNGGPNPATVAVQATNLDTFSPRDIVVDKGTVVTWTNTDVDDHTVIVDPLDPVAGGPNSDVKLGTNILPGHKYSWTCPNVASGTVFYYHCRLHGTAGNGHDFGTGMVGVIVVR